MSLRTREAALIFLGLVLTYGQFFQASTWGAACRFDLARALAEQQTIRIDDYHENTGDKALLNGIYYSDKAPLPSYLGAPGVALASTIRAALPESMAQSFWLALAGGLATLFASGWVTALGGAVFFLALRDRAVPSPVAALVTAIVFLGTTLFPYATVLQGHAPAAAWVFVFFHLLFPANGDPCFRRGILAGVAASAAVATEYLTGPPLVALAILFFARYRGRGWKTGLAVAAGALPGAIMLGLYHQAAFGGPFSVGYQHVALPFFQEKMSRGFLGIALPDPAVAARLLVGPFRGLVFASPVLAMGLIGLGLWARDASRRWDAAAGVIVFFFYWALNSGYATWHGGWAIGPRHLVPTIPFLGLGVAAAYGRWPRVTAGLGAVSVLFMLAATSVQPEVPEDIRNPLFQHLLPHFVSGELTVGEQGFGDLYPARLDPAVPDRWDAFLLGDLLRLPGRWALLPVFAVWLGTVLLFRRWTRAAPE